MKAKEKAKELVYSMFNVDLECKDESMCMLYPHAKQCALICVDEIIKECYRWTGQGNGQWENGRLEYWERVKYEINKL